MASSSSTSPSFSHLLLLLSLLSVSSAQSIPRAAAILSDSGFKSMSLALDLASLFLNSPSPSLTVFAPPDAAFAAAGEPSLDLIRLHLSPVAFPLRSFRSLPFGAKIATLLDGSSLAVTSSLADRLVSLNNVTVTAAPIFDDGELIIFRIESFFDRSFLISAPIHGCLEPPNPNEAMAGFGEAIKVLEDPLSPILGPSRKPNTEPSCVECDCHCSSPSKPLWWNVGNKVMAFAILAVVDKTTRSVFGWSLLFWVLQVDSAGWRRLRSKRSN